MADRLLALYRHDKPATATVVAMFAQVDSLPGSQFGSAIGMLRLLPRMLDFRCISLCIHMSKL
jgi:hypothetical protein